MKARARREFATNYANALVMAHKADQMGMNKGTKFEEQMKVARVQILSQEMRKLIQNKASQIFDVDIENHYHANTSAFEQAEIERIYVPKAQDQPAAPGKTQSETGKQEQLHRSEQIMKDQADQLHERAIRGEDFSRLQADAYKTAGINTTGNPSLGKIRRVSLPKEQVWVMDLKPGEVSSVIDAPNGYLIYKIKGKEVLSLSQVREEIRGLLKSQHLQ
jgi:PPIC-type PPIASE domain